MSWSSRLTSIFPAFVWCINSNKIDEDEKEFDNANSSYLCSTFELLKRGLTEEQISSLNEQLDQSQSTIFHYIRLCILNNTPFNLVYVLYSLDFKFNYNFNQQSDALIFYERIFELCQKESLEKNIPNIFSNFQILNQSLFYECEGCNNEKEERRINTKGFHHLLWTGPKGMTTQQFIDSFLHPSSQYDCESCHSTTDWKGKKFVNFGERILIVISAPADCKYKPSEEITVNQNNYYLSSLIVRTQRDNTFFFHTKFLRPRVNKIGGDNFVEVNIDYADENEKKEENEEGNFNDINKLNIVKDYIEDEIVVVKEESEKSSIIIEEQRIDVKNLNELKMYYEWCSVPHDNPSSISLTTLNESDIVTQLLYSKFIE